MAKMNDFEEEIYFPKEYHHFTDTLTELVKVKEKKTWMQSNGPKTVIVSVFEAMASLMDWVEDWSHGLEETKQPKVRISHMVRQICKLKYEHPKSDLINQIRCIEKQLHSWQTELVQHQRRISAEKKVTPIYNRKHFQTLHNIPSLAIHVLTQKKELQISSFFQLMPHSYQDILWLTCYSSLQKEEAKIISLQPRTLEPIHFKLCQKNTRLAFLAIPKDSNALPVLWTASQPQLGELSFDAQSDIISTLKLEISQEYMKLFCEPFHFQHRQRYLRYFSTKGSKKKIALTTQKDFSVFLHQLKELIRQQTIRKKRKQQTEDCPHKRIKTELDDFLLAFGLD